MFVESFLKKELAEAMMILCAVNLAPSSVMRVTSVRTSAFLIFEIVFFRWLLNWFHFKQNFCCDSESIIVQLYEFRFLYITWTWLTYTYYSKKNKFITIKYIKLRHSSIIHYSVEGSCINCLWFTLFHWLMLKLSSVKYVASNELDVL